jgi:hypothetical protein
VLWVKIAGTGVLLPENFTAWGLCVHGVQRQFAVWSSRTVGGEGLGGLTVGSASVALASPASNHIAWVFSLGLDCGLTTRDEGPRRRLLTSSLKGWMARPIPLLNDGLRRDTLDVAYFL